MQLTLVPAAEFQMGSDESDNDTSSSERPQHRARITQPFYLGTYEVTKGQFRKFVDATGYKTDAEKDGKGGGGYTSDKDSSFPFEQRANFTWRHWGVDQSDESPVANVSQNDAVAFCEWLSKKEGNPYGLPTEAQWEYACRAGTTTLYYNGNEPEELTRIANVADKTTKEKIQKFPWGVASSDGWAFTSPVGQFRSNNFGLYDMIGNAWEWCADW
jgi:formylglycine-generating enzyme required for sulfatase activity